MLTALVLLNVYVAFSSSMWGQVRQPRLKLQRKMPEEVCGDPRGVLPIMDYTGRLRPKGVPFSGWRYIKGYGFHELKHRKGLGKLT